MSTYAVIMCGGSGSRLWPASRPLQPKQFAALVGPLSSFQETVKRVEGLPDLAGLLVVAGAAHEPALATQLADLGSAATLILEPEARDSAAAMAAACAWIAARDPLGVAVILAADHHVPDAAAFAKAVDHAAQAARFGLIVTLGVKPATPSSAYGYIAPGPQLPDLPNIFKVQRFVEKPDSSLARDYISKGYLWNSGNFMVSAKTLLDELARFAPAVRDAAVAAVAGAGETSPVRLSDAFRAAPKISIDYAVMEKTDLAAVLPVDFGWSDLGAWDAVWTHSNHDAEGNAVKGHPILIDVHDSLIHDRDHLTTVAIGVRNLAIVTEVDQVLVCDLDSSQSVKIAYERLKAAGRGSIHPLPPPLRSLKTWLDLSALPLWWSLGADHTHGGFFESLDHLGRPTRAPRRLRVQARQACVYGLATARGWSGQGEQACKHGLAAIEAEYYRADGLYRTLTSDGGEVLDDTAMLYDQAFVLLALSTAPGREAALVRAEALLDVLEARQRHLAGGFREEGGEPSLSNPHMHLFEAALAWEESGGGPRWAALSDEIAGLCLQRFIDSAGGFLREAFDAHWRPTSTTLGRRVEPGHQFEWAWLLERWAKRRGSAEAARAARRLFTAGAAGVDPVRNLAVDALDEEIRHHERTARLWPQTERLKAAIILRDPTDPACPYAAHVPLAVTSIWTYLDGLPAGLWRDRALLGGGFADGPSPASTLYHLAVAIEELATAGLDDEPPLLLRTVGD